MKEGKPKKVMHDWQALKVEFLAGHETMNAFRIRHGIASTWFYRKAHDWAEARERIGNKAMKKVESKLVDYYGNYIEQTRKLLANISNQFAKALQNTMKVGPDGERTIVPMDPDKLSSMSGAIATNVRTLRLIEGKSTENKSVKVTGDLNERLVGLIEAMKEEGEDTVGEI